MHTKLNCIIVDDDPSIHETLTDLMANCPTAIITNTFTCPKKFLAIERTLEFDICILDIYMPEINGFMVAEELEKRNKGIIFLSGVEAGLLESLGLDSPIDLVPKPIKKERLFKALEKAQKIHQKENKHVEKLALFSVAESEGKLRLHPSDIVYVKTDKIERRHKHITLKNGKEYLLLNYTLDRLLALSPNLIQVNKAELISLEIVHEINSDLITLDGVKENGKPKQVTLSRTYSKLFREQTCN